MKKVDWGWQGKAKTLQERGDYLLKNYPIPADITFEFADDDARVVDEGAVPVKKTIAAHKFILALGSEVFHAMFYGPAADAALARVPIPKYS
ncbi:hypothetical protein RvY_17341 [Ramazzottius varieornatus]|uniref:BTB domain-containing protein n=1 Tax=Ramazzottius varieornatus TaxID=947166 RepID=A0A1D1W1S1_RAMVA|nr:hypothetical protein RvY_17341 [Ramazzottius varieornatus]